MSSQQLLGGGVGHRSYEPSQDSTPTRLYGRRKDDASLIRQVQIAERQFAIRLADTEHARNSASLLINKLYTARGYKPVMLADDPNTLTLSAWNGDQIFGTCTLGLDSPAGLLADHLFRDQIDVRRKAGARVCEITRLAFDPEARSKHALAGVFHTLYIYARYMHGCTDMFIEVNPRHRSFYENQLGFKMVGDERQNLRVNAPANLLWADLAMMGRRIRQAGGTSTSPDRDRSLFPYCFSPREEQGILMRLYELE
jgi:hypothetical protein